MEACLKLAVQVLNKTMDSTTPSPEKMEFTTITRVNGKVMTGFFLSRVWFVGLAVVEPIVCSCVRSFGLSVGDRSQDPHRTVVGFLFPWHLSFCSDRTLHKISRQVLRVRFACFSCVGRSRIQMALIVHNMVSLDRRRFFLFRVVLVSFVRYFRSYTRSSRQTLVCFWIFLCRSLVHSDRIQDSYLVCCVLLVLLLRRSFVKSCIQIVHKILTLHNLVFLSFSCVVRSCELIL